MFGEEAIAEFWKDRDLEAPLKVWQRWLVE
jgi:hypothetical protein